MMIFLISVRLLSDSLERTFLQCPANVKVYHEILSWFNVSLSTLINLSPEQILMQKYIPGPINDNFRRRLDLLILLVQTFKVRSTLQNCFSRREARERKKNPSLPYFTLGFHPHSRTFVSTVRPRSLVLDLPSN